MKTVMTAKNEIPIRSSNTTRIVVFLGVRLSLVFALINFLGFLVTIISENKSHNQIGVS